MRLALDLFAGAGGASLGLTRSGFEVVHVERDPDACNVLRAAFPGDVVIEGDLRDRTTIGALPKRPDLLWASFPCQCWSTAGKRLGARDTERNGWPWTLNAIDATGPTWVICENVPGLTYHKGGAKNCPRDRPMDCPACYLDLVILPQLRERFAFVDRRTMDAADWGTPQRRKRIFIVAGPEEFCWPLPTHGDPKKPLGDRAPWRTVRDALNIAPGRSVAFGDTRAGNDKHPARSDEPAAWVSTKGTAYEVPDLALTPQHMERIRRYEKASGVRDRTLDPDRPARTVSGRNAEGSTNDCLRISMEREDPSRGWEPTDVDSPSPSPRAGRPGGGLRVHDEDAVRRLTVAEVAALFSMPPDWPWSGTKTAKYRQIGNMVAWKAAYALGASVREHLFLAGCHCGGAVACRERS